MKKVVSFVWTFGIILGAAFQEEKRNGVFIGVAEVDDISAFLNPDGSVKDGFEIEGYTPEIKAPEAPVSKVVKFESLETGIILEIDPEKEPDLLLEAETDPTLKKLGE